MKDYSYYLFDWNGTLLDDRGINIEIENLLLSRRGLPQLPSEVYYLKNFGFPIIDFYISLGFDFEKESYEAVAVEYAEEFLASPCFALDIGIPLALEATLRAARKSSAV